MNALAWGCGALLLSASALWVSPVHAKESSKTVAEAAGSSQAKAKAVADPLAGDTWHAVQSTWPGTLVFNGAKKTVILAPVGATPMEASYLHTITSKPKAKVIEGKLTMTNAAQQVSESTFTIEGKNMILRYATGQNPEYYVKMTPQEEAADKAKIEKLIKEGRLRRFE